MNFWPLFFLVVCVTAQFKKIGGHGRSSCMACTSREDYYCHRYDVCREGGHDEDYCKYWVGCKGKFSDAGCSMAQGITFLCDEIDFGPEFDEEEL
eukprot:TRINITY_DN2578_c0_g1_i2.p1 TRINITY_DN2578_c0_g1~~TRINITY_DN2578_c0_g1_i2.p1  ORF type:complete len:95 (+),score=12.69 TRINITY_DN2578_c0_g1_i2:155-439(+)